MNDHSKGLLITLIGVLFVVPDSIMVRLISSDPMVTAFWRSLTAGTFVAIFVFLIVRDDVMKTITQMGRAGWIYCVLIGTTSPAFVLAVQNTSVANVVLIFASMPVFSALLSFLILSERAQPSIVADQFFCFCGPCHYRFGFKWWDHGTLDWGFVGGLYRDCVFHGIDPATATKTYIHVAGDPHWIHWRGLRNVLVHRSI